MNFDIQKIKRKMLVKYPFFGSVVANVNYKENNNISIAGTDGKTIYYNQEYLDGLSIPEQTFVFAHEVCHIAFNHILRSEGKDQEIWNIATDAVINAFLVKDGLKMVKGGIDIEGSINHDAETLYEKLLKEKEKKSNEENDGQNSKQNSSSNNNDNNSKKYKYDRGHATHSMWEEGVENSKQESNKSEEEKEIANKQKETNKLGEKESFNKNREEKKKNLEKLKEELAKESAQAGKTTNSDERIVHNIGVSKPIIDWRYILRETIKYDVDWSYKNATIENGVVTANLEEYPTPETEIVLDTSGSVDENLLKNFLRECKNIIKHSKVKVGCFDTKFYGFQEIRTEKDIEEMKFLGGGGTDFNVAVNAFTRRVENKIIFTDGEANMPETPLDAIWMVFGREQINPKGGKVIHIDRNDLRKLSINTQNIKIKKRIR